MLISDWLLTTTYYSWRICIYTACIYSYIPKPFIRPYFRRVRLGGVSWLAIITSTRWGRCTKSAPRNVTCWNVENEFSRPLRGLDGHASFLCLKNFSGRHSGNALRSPSTLDFFWFSFWLQRGILEVQYMRRMEERNIWETLRIIWDWECYHDQQADETNISFKARKFSIVT